VRYTNVDAAREALRTAIEALNEFHAALGGPRHSLGQDASKWPLVDEMREAAYGLLCKEADDACAAYVEAHAKTVPHGTSSIVSPEQVDDPAVSVTDLIEDTHGRPVHTATIEEPDGTGVAFWIDSMALRPRNVAVLIERMRTFLLNAHRKGAERS
jgi:hypothetical protein